MSVLTRLFSYRKEMGIAIAAPYITGIIMGVGGILVHFIYFLFFLHQKIYPMVFFNCFSIPWFILIVVIAIKTNSPHTWTMAALEMIPHQILAVYFVGWTCSFQKFLFLIPIMMGMVLWSYKNILHYLITFAAGSMYLFLWLRHFNALPVYPVTVSWMERGMGILNITTVIIMLGISGWVYGYVAEKSQNSIEREYNRAEGLLLNILPAEIAGRLKEGEDIIADQFDQASVLFLDIVDFTTLSTRLTAPEIVQILNDLFSRFDRLADHHGLEKIKTIGDAYMAVAGIPEPVSNHAKRCVDMARDMMAEIDSYSKTGPVALQARIGICSGPVVAGVIGKRKFIYDLWGDTVNTASRMESHGSPSRIQITASTYELLKNDYDFEYRGTIDVKGKGPMETWFLIP